MREAMESLAIIMYLRFQLSSYALRLTLYGSKSLLMRDGVELRRTRDTDTVLMRSELQNS